MKLAEALILRADLQRRLEQLQSRLVGNAKVQEGDPPAEDPQALLGEMEQVSSELEKLIQRINRTNSATELEPGLSLSDALAVRDMLRLRQGMLRNLVQAASVSQTRYSRSEVRFQSTVNVAEIQKRADDLAREHRELDTRIQEANWLTDLID